MAAWDKGYFAKPFLAALFKRRITPHIAAKTTGRETVHQRVRRMSRTVGYQRCRSGRGRRSKSCGVRRNVGMASAAFAGADSSRSETKPI